MEGMSQSANNAKKMSYNNKTYFEFKLPIAVININHMISNYINIHRIISQIVIVNDKLLDHDIIHYHPGVFNVLFSCLPLGTSVYCNI
jgi:hypothetical protein